MEIISLEHATTGKLLKFTIFFIKFISYPLAPSISIFWIKISPTPKFSQYFTTSNKFFQFFLPEFE